MALDQEQTGAALEWLVPAGPGLGATGAFADGTAPGPGADPFTRVLALTGRDTR
ncbi:hypothetical protein [Streptomyces sp. NPDC059850]|uniref:hypothetical protein n=1 Tax=Streptomyces sp. NPDC059850 TaxID=3346970 RepID=UPI0036628778